jgi:hypothetical protein
MKGIISIVRIMSFIIISAVMGGVISALTGVSILPAAGVFAGLSLFPSHIIKDAGVLATLIGTHTGATSYSGTVEQPIARLLIDADSTTALATVTAAKLSVSIATPTKTSNIIPEMTFAQLADLAGFIDAVYYELTAQFQIKFSIPLSLGGALNLGGGSLQYNITSATAADTIKVFAIDDAKLENDYIEIVPVSCPANAVKIVDVVKAAYFFIDPTAVTKIKVNYATGRSPEYTGDEIQEIARVVNPVHKVTNAGVMTAGYGTLAGLNVIDATSIEVQASSLQVGYVLKVQTLA